MRISTIQENHLTPRHLPTSNPPQNGLIRSYSPLPRPDLVSYLRLLQFLQLLSPILLPFQPLPITLGLLFPACLPLQKRLTCLGALGSKVADLMAHKAGFALLSWVPILWLAEKHYFRTGCLTRFSCIWSILSVWERALTPNRDSLEL